MKVAANQMVQSFRFARSEGVDAMGRWIVFVGEQDPKLLDSSLRAMGYEFFEMTDDDGNAVTGYMKDYVDLQIMKASRIVASGTIVGYEIAIFADTDDVEALGLTPMEGDSGDGDSADDSFTDNMRNQF
jgi:hypothetical protein